MFDSILSKNVLAALAVVALAGATSCTPADQAEEAGGDGAATTTESSDGGKASDGGSASK